MLLDYIKKDAGDIFSFPGSYDDYRQTFDHDFNMSRTCNEAVTVKLFAGAVDEWPVGLETLRNLYRFNFATRDQLLRLLKLKGLDDPEMFDAVLEKYIERKFINKFCLAQAPLDTIPDDAMTVYCLDHSAKFILGHFTNDPNIINTWKSSNCMYSGNIVFKYLTTNEFYISMCEVKGLDTSTFEPAPDFIIRGRAVRLSGWFRVKSEGKTENILLEAIRQSDLPLTWEKKVDTHLTPFIKENFASRYFSGDPTWFFVTDSQNSALQIAEIFERMTECKRYRLTTSEELRKGLDRAVFYKYENEKLLPTKPKIFAAKS